MDELGPVRVDEDVGGSRAGQVGDQVVPAAWTVELEGPPVVTDRVGLLGVEVVQRVSEHIEAVIDVGSGVERDDLLVYGGEFRVGVLADGAAAGGGEAEVVPGGPGRICGGGQ